MASIAVRIHGLEKKFIQGETEVKALRGVELEVPAGAFVAVMGPSGSGKSTLLHIVGALESATAGEVWLGDRRLDGLSDIELTRLRRDRIGFVFQFFNLLPTLTARENVLLPALISGESVNKFEERTVELLELVGLMDRADHLPAQLSGGEQQRVSIARALLKRPELVLADEPTGNLDSKSGDEILRLLRAACTGYGHTVVMVSHDAHAASLADRVVFLRDGVVVGAVEGGDTRRIIEHGHALEAESPVAAGPT